VHIIFHIKGHTPIRTTDANRIHAYIQNQVTHHAKISFKDEYLMFLKEYGIEYDERYIWDD